MTEARDLIVDGDERDEWVELLFVDVMIQRRGDVVTGEIGFELSAGLLHRTRGARGAIAIAHDFFFGQRPAQVAEVTRQRAKRQAAEEILHRHEDRCASECELNAGCEELLGWLKSRNIELAVVTRNSRRSAATVFERHGIRIDTLITRDDGIYKPSPQPLLFRIHAGRASILRDAIRQQCPRRPGVYGMVDPRGRLIYVGKAKCLRARLLGYFRAASRDPKAGRIIEATRAVVWEFAANEFAALLRELELIRRWTPSYNVQGRPGRRRGMYIVLGKKPGTYLFATAEPPADLIACYGPLPGAAFVQEAARRLRQSWRA